MATERSLARQAAPPVRKPPVASAPVVRPVVAPSPALLLQRRLGNQGTAAFVARSALRVSSPHDPAEREATAKAAEVMRTPAPSASAQVAVATSPIVQRCACGRGQPCACEVQRAASSPGPVGPEVAGEIHGSMSGGTALPAGVRGFMEPRFGADFSGVRIHTGGRAAQLSENLNAHAFTVGKHVFFGKDQYRPDTQSGKELIAHELTHTLQQGSVQRSATGGSLLVQRDEKKSWWERLTDWGESFAWDMVREVAPSMVPILQKGPGGVLDWIGEKVSAAVDGVFNTLMAPVRAITGVGETLSAMFAPMLATLQVAAGQIASNDCSPLRQAAEKIEKTALRIITPIVEKLQPVVAKVKEFLNGLWDKFGAPIWGWIKSVAEQQWEAILWLADGVKKFYKWIWDKTAWARDLASKAWTWIKNKLGIGEGAEGQDGLLQWVQGKVEAAWAAIKTKIEPFKKELTAIGLAVAGVALALSPAGPVLAIGAAVAGAIQGLRWIAANWGKGNLIVQARVYLEKSLIPSLLGAAKRVGDAVTRMAGSVSATLGSLAAGMVRAVGSLAGSVLRFAVSAVQWLANQAVALAGWATSQLADLSHWLTDALASLKAFLQRMLAFLARVGEVILDIWGLPLLLAGKVWNAIPACIRDPIVDFLGPIILRQIELFSELVKDNEAWQKTKADVMKIIHLVFKDHDLVGAVKATFRLILRVFNIPPELLVTIANKAMAAWDVISKKPLEFIKNTVRSIGHGFRLLWENLWEDLKDGLQGWLFGELKSKNISPPASWSNPKDLFFFALEVLGLSVDHVWELLAKRFDDKKVQAVRKRFGQVVRVLDWINTAIDTTKSPKENAQGIWAQAKEFGGAILTGIAEWVAAKVAEELAIMAAAAAASGGLSEVLDVLRRVYKALLTAKRYARRILDMVNQGLDNILDIAGGAVVKVGIAIHKIMKLGMPVVIGFLAEQVGLGGVGAALRETVDKLRAKVDEGILWFIDTIKAALEAIIGAVKAGVKALVDWAFATTKFKDAKGTTHKVFVSDSGVFTMESTPETIEAFLTTYLTTRKDPEGLAGEIRTLLGKARPLVEEILKAKAEKGEVPAPEKQKELLGISTEISALLGKLIGRDPNLGKKKKEKYKLEGLVGTYEGIPKPVGDQLTPDHQPQASVIRAAADFFEKLKIQGGALAERARKRAAKGYAINLFFNRHVAGATYGSKGKTQAGFLSELMAASAQSTAKDDATMRTMVGTKLKAELDKDVAAMKDVAASGIETKAWADIKEIEDKDERDELKSELQSRIVAGENQIASQPLDF